MQCVCCRYDEWTMVAALVRPHDTVLELGARYGTTSCALAKATNNSGQVVSVEPVRYVLPYLLKNRRKHECAFHVLHGTVGHRAQRIIDRKNDPYGTYTTGDDRSDAGGPRASCALRCPPFFSPAQVEQLIGRRFTVALIDCEGCIDDLFGGAAGKHFLSTLQLILLEEDQAQTVDYAQWSRRFAAEGFTRVWHIGDSFAAHMRALRHSAWQRGGLHSDQLSCRAYSEVSRTSAKHSARVLRCLEP
jgi:FkbM family methyltransferase